MTPQELVIQVVDKINTHFVYDGLPARLEDLVPLLSYHYYAEEHTVQFCGFTVWDSINDPYEVSETPELLERFLIARVAEIRKVLNHATSGIPNSILDAVRDDVEEKL